MKKALLVLVSLLLLDSCGPIRKVIITEQTVVHHVDSVAYHDSTVYHDVYREHFKEYTGLLDTLRMENSYSTFTAYNDTTAKTLKGEVKNKSVSLPQVIKWKEKIVYKDSIQVKEVPVEVEVMKTKYPTTYWLLLGFFVLTLIFIGIKIYLKFKI